MSNNLLSKANEEKLENKNQTSERNLINSQNQDSNRNDKSDLTKQLQQQQETKFSLFEVRFKTLF